MFTPETSPSVQPALARTITETFLPRAHGRRERSLSRPMSRLHWLIFAGIIGLAAFFDLFLLSENSYGNPYYASAVKSMAQNWHNFFFVAFDPGGFVTVDKPPVGLWLQVLSVKLFGFSSLSLLLPQALAGVLVVALLFFLVRRTAGMLAATVAALAMTLSPVGVVMSRDNNLDVPLLLVLLLVIWAMMRAVESGRFRWLLLSMILMGIGFNIKTFQAYLVLPALGVFYLLFSTHKGWLRLLSLFCSLLLLLVISFSWITLVDLTPAAQRPYVGSSQTNSELELALGYNGIARLFRPSAGPSPKPKPTTRPDVPEKSANVAQALFLPLFSQLSQLAQADGADESVIVGNPTGSPGPLRLLMGPLGAQGSWLFLFVLVSLPAFLWQRRWRRAAGQEMRALILWGGWLLTVLIALSLAVHIQSYYALMLVPPLSALSGIAAALLWRDYRRRALRDPRGWLLPLALLSSTTFQITLLRGYPGWSSWLAPLLLILTLLSAGSLIVLRLWRLAPGLRLALMRAALLSGLLALLAAPFIWSAASLTYPNDGGFPVAGPPVATLQGTMQVLDRTLTRMPGAYNLSPSEQRLADYLLVRRGKATYLLATLNSSNAAPFILVTGQPVMTLGGYAGGDRILTPAQLAALVVRGTVRFFWLPLLFRADGGSGQWLVPGGANSVLTRWVVDHCALSRFQAEKVVPLQIRTTGPLTINRLYDCAKIAYN